MKKFILLLVSVGMIGICGCVGHIATSDNQTCNDDRQCMKLLKMGMTEQEALRVMGHEPDSYHARDNIKDLIYNINRDEYFIRFKDGKLVEYGRTGLSI